MNHDHVGIVAAFQWIKQSSGWVWDQTQLLKGCLISGKSSVSLGSMSVSVRPSTLCLALFFSLPASQWCYLLPGAGVGERPSAPSVLGCCITGSWGRWRDWCIFGTCMLSLLDGVLSVGWNVLCVHCSLHHSLLWHTIKDLTLLSGHCRCCFLKSSQNFRAHQSILLEAFPNIH